MTRKLREAWKRSTESKSNGVSIAEVPKRDTKRRQCFAALWAAFGIGCAAIGNAQSEPPSFALPVDCEIGAQCLIQNYVDHDPGSGAMDYQCGSLTYDGHKGTDIRLANVAAMNQGVKVLAAAPGRVRAVRDGMADINARAIGKDAVAGKEAGNSVVIRHGDGWETQYAHLREGSVMVKPGAFVERGQPLGLIGMSGLAEFPHLHFEARLDGNAVDPFVGAAEHTHCGPGSKVLWLAKARAALKYAASGVINSGFAGNAVNLAEAALNGVSVPAATSPAFLFWVQIYGAQAGDEEIIRILAPDGRILAGKRVRVPGNKAVWFSIVGKNRRGFLWPTGIYRAEYSLQRLGNDGMRQAVSLVREFHLLQE